MSVLLRLLARLPAGASYRLSSVISWLLFHVLRYRRRTVRENIACAFPDTSRDERARLERDFYRHFCDLFMEVLRSTTMEMEEFASRVTFSNPELLAEVTDNHAKQAIILLIHQGNWEWTLHGATHHLPVHVDPVYKPLHNAFWDDYMLKARSRFGAQPMSIAGVSRAVIKGRKRKRIIVMLADQAGPRLGGYWTDFLHRPASFNRGADKLAQILKVPVLFAQCQRVSRGRYQISFHTISLPPHSDDGEAILESYVRTAERMIAAQPETYLWTNRRWKKTPPETLT